MKSKFHLFYFFVAATLWYSCAQIAAPTGGPKDLQPPRVESYEPDSAAVNFSGKTISIRFNENIQLKDENTQVYISPPLRRKPRVKAKNKTLTVEWDENLQPGTTYCIQFGEAVRDVNEGNVLKNFRYVFSTGPAIDNLEVKGSVQNAFDLKKEKGVLVMLYSDLSDSVPFKSQPSYFARTGEDGSFVISNIKPGNYRIFALKDSDNDFLYNSLKDEPVAFLNDLINPEAKKTILLNLFREPLSFQYIKKSGQPEYGHVMMVFNYPPQKITLSPLGSVPAGDWKVEEWSKNRDTLTLWLPGPGGDSLKLNVLDENRLIGTLFLKLVTKAEHERRSRGKEIHGLYPQTNIGANKMIPLNARLILRFNHPLKNNEDLLKVLTLKEDTVLLKPENLALEKISLREYAISRKTPEGTSKSDSVPMWKENAEYKLEILPGKLSDMLGYANDSIRLKFKTGEMNQYGNFRLKIKTGKRLSPLLQLLDEKGNVVKEKSLKGEKQVDFYMLLPGKYSARIIEDSNGNGRWDPGNYLKKIQPETVVYFPGSITIRANWDLELEWIAE